MAKTFNFINPYNFIPLSKTPVSHVNEEEKKLKGVIEYSLLTKTPLFIPNTSNDHAICPETIRDAETGKLKEEYHKSYEFFAYEDLSNLTEKKSVDDLLAPVIPGSEIRGMFRSNYEILTNSCLSAIDDDIVLSRRNPHAFKAALIFRKSEKQFELIEGEDMLLRTLGADNLTIDINWEDDNLHNSRKCFRQQTFREGQKVFVTKDPYRKKSSYIKPVVSAIVKAGKGIEGYVLMGEEGPDMTDSHGNTPKNQKHCCHIISVKKKDGKEIILAKNLDISVLDKVLKIYKDNGEHPYTAYTTEWEKFKRGEGEKYFPVYYSSIDQKYFMLSPAVMTHEVYKAQLSNLVSSHRTCRDKKNLCPACKLFGTIQKDEKGKNFSVASRIRFSDLSVSRDSASKELYQNPIMLKELSSPKLGNVEFYLQRPKDALFWTYDYYIDEKGTVKPYTAEISGRKFYWHNLGMSVKDVKADEQTVRNVTVRPVTSNVLFKGRVYFDDISTTELNQLLYLVNVGDFSTTDIALKDKTHGYKLGGAKPLGFGSVALQIDCVKLRSVKRDTENRTIIHNSADKAPKYLTPSFDNEIISNFEKMTSFSTIEEYTRSNYQYSYPIPEEADKNGERNIFDWFVANHKGYDLSKQRNVKMPNDRSQVMINEFMQPMNPVLISTGFLPNISPYSKPKKKVEMVFEKGKEYKGIADERKNDRYIRITLQNGRKTSVFDGNKVLKGDHVIVIYEGESKGRDGKMYPNWKLKQ